MNSRFPAAMINDFAIAPTPQLIFGAGRIAQLVSATAVFGPKLLLVTGKKSFASLPSWQDLIGRLSARPRQLEHVFVDREPTPRMIDDAVRTFAGFAPDCVAAIGGGSVLDAGKALSAMLPLQEPVKSYLEGVGTKIHPGKRIPFVAVPTTAGTGSEATKNAVLSEPGEGGFKKSLRHNRFIPDVAIVDPALTRSCPPGITASGGMDAFTQLLESYVSTAANPVTDALALEGLRHVAASLNTVYTDGGNLEARTGMALAAYLSGITLANAGLGTVHGFASVLGGAFDIPHGVICSALMPAVNRITVQKLRALDANSVALKKYACAGRLFSGKKDSTDNYYTDHLLSVIETWRYEMKIPAIGDFGAPAAKINELAAMTENKNHPVDLDLDERKSCLMEAW